MKYNKSYQEKVSLLIDVLSLIDWNMGVALKGGTAINLFLLELPRLSVDIDIAYIPFVNREKDLIGIEIFFYKLIDSVKRSGMSATIQTNSGTKTVTKISVNNQFAQIIVEANFIAKGTLLKTESLTLCKTGINEFEKSCEAICLNRHEIYAGKMNAFLSRQHPRDIFDMMEYAKTSSLSSIIDVIMIYILQNNRPFYELLNPNEIDISDAYQSSFVGMTREEVKLETLIEARTGILSEFKKCIKDEHIDFFISCLKGTPKWDVFDQYNIKDLPGVKWRMINISKMPGKKKKEEIDKLLEIKSTLLI